MQGVYVAASYFVVISPALDVASGFPINAITLANNLAQLWLGDSAGDKGRADQIKKTSRLIACVPPIIGALLVNDLGVVTRYTGVALEGYQEQKVSVLIPTTRALDQMKQ
eukprot:5249725-Ditylum_brightwellii.AAC.1